MRKLQKDEKFPRTKTVDIEKQLVVASFTVREDDLKTTPTYACENVTFDYSSVSAKELYELATSSLIITIARRFRAKEGLAQNKAIANHIDVREALDVKRTPVDDVEAARRKLSKLDPKVRAALMAEFPKLA